jgi:hypothetical protein
MNRCVSLSAAMAGLLAVLAATQGGIAAAQTPLPALNQGQMPIIGTRQFPASAKRGTLEVKMPPLVAINGVDERLSPGARIRGPNNQLVMSGQLVGRAVQVNYVRDNQGMVHEVWILNALEAQEEREGSGPVINYRFESQIDPAKKP